MARSKKIPGQPTVDFADIEERRKTLSLRGYQTKHLAAFMQNERYLDLSEAGTGKTAPACVYIYWMYAEKGLKTTWAMPLSLLEKNYEELLLWSGFDPDEVIVLGSKAQRPRQLAHPRGKVFLTSFEGFSSNWEEIREAHPTMNALVADEWHLGYKGHGNINFRGKLEGSRRTYNMYRFMHNHGERFLAMTGTLLDGRLDAAYPALQVIEPRYYGTHSKFLDYHAFCDGWGSVVGWKNHDRLAQILKKHSVRVTFKEAYGEENKQIFIETCQMSKAQRDAYEELEETAMLELEDVFVDTEDNAAVTLLRCLQVMQHPESFGLKEDPHRGKTAHAKTFIETANQSEQPIVIFEPTVPGQKRLYELACKVCGDDKVAWLGGHTSQSQRGLIDQRIRSNQIFVTVAAPDVAGVGFNWGHINTMLFTGLDWQDSTFIQNYRRAIRGKRETPLKIYLLQYSKSVDQRIAHKVNQKSSDRLKVMGDDDTGVRIVQKPEPAAEPKAGPVRMTDYL